MKGLIYKDICNITHNMKSMIVALLMAGCTFFQNSAVEGYIAVSAMLCGMMIATTFTFDEKVNWDRLAMTMPIKKEDFVKSKFLTLIIFCASGTIWGNIVSSIVLFIKNGINYFSTDKILELVLVSCAFFLVALLFGSFYVTCIFKYGAEKARALVFVAYVIPVAIAGGLYMIFKTCNIVLNFYQIVILAIIIDLVLEILSYKISCRIVAKKEF